MSDRRFRRGFAAALIIFLFAMIFSLGAAVFAVDEADGSELMLFDFDSDEVSSGVWSCGDNVSEVKMVTHYFEESDNLNRRECLEAVSRDVSVNLIRGTRVDFFGPLDLTEYRTFAFDLFAEQYEQDPFADHYVRVTMYSSDGTSTENIFVVRSGEWTGVSLDIGTWSGRSSVASAEIAVTVATTVGGSRSDSFYIDNVRAGDKIDRGRTARFMFDNYTVSGGTAVMTDSYLDVGLSGEAMTTLDATVFVPDNGRELNCLRLRLINRSDSGLLILHYSTSDSAAQSEDRILSVRLEPGEDRCDYYLDVGDVGKLASIRMQFESGEGHIIIDSLCAMSAYRQEIVETKGSAASCKVGDDLASVRFTGEVSREEALSNQNGKIEIYASLASSESVDINSLSSGEAILSSPMTTKFDLTAHITRDEILSSRFVVISRRTDGSAALIAAPRYIDNPERFASVSVKRGSGKKGAVVSDISKLDSLRADSTIIEITAEELFGSDTSAIRYEHGGGAYYFSGTALKRLGLTISAANSSGADVFLRLRGFDDFEAAPSADSHGFAFGTSPDGDDFISASAAYIAENWCADGSVDGIILGTCLNFYDRDGAELHSLNEIVSRDALSARKIAYELLTVNSESKLYISVSDMYSVGLASETSEIGLEQYLSAFAKEAQKDGDFAYGIEVQSFYRFDDPETETDELADILSTQKLINLLGARKSEPTFLFTDNSYDFPTTLLGTLAFRLCRGYYAALSDDRIDAYIPVLTTEKRVSELEVYLRSLDTTDSMQISETTLVVTEHSSWSAVISGFSEKKIPAKKTYYAEAEYELPAGIKGSFAYFRFDTAGDTKGFKPGYYCTGVSCPTGASALVAELSGRAYGSSSGGDMGVWTRFSHPEDMSLTPVVSLNLRLDEVSPEADGAIPVRIIFTAGSDRIETTAEIEPGRDVAVYVNVGQYDAAENIDGIIILTDDENLDSAVLSLYGIEGLSREYNDESLESVVADARAKRRSAVEGTSVYGKYFWIAGGILIGVATVLTVVLLSRKKDEQDG